MPLLKEWSVAQHTRAAIWKIEEDEAFFASKTGLAPDMQNARRRTEYLAGRYLLSHLEEEISLHHIVNDEHGKPRVENDEYYFSLSHSWPYVAAITDPYKETGIDIQTWHKGIAGVQHKFLSPAEQDMLGNDGQLLNTAWAAKEALYKWNGRKGVSLMGHLSIEQFRKKDDKIEMTIYSKMNKMPQMVYIESLLTADFTCACVVSAQDWAIY